MTAADVMNTDVKYIYPITRVRSIERLLRVTAHNAFFVMSPPDTKHPHQQDMGGDDDSDVMETSMQPKLYERITVMPLRKVRALQQKGVDGADTTMSANNESAKQASSENCVLRGVILRHQLVELLRNKIFFEESSGVRGE